MRTELLRRGQRSLLLCELKSPEGFAKIDREIAQVGGIMVPPNFLFQLNERLEVCITVQNHSERRWYVGRIVHVGVSGAAVELVASPSGDIQWHMELGLPPKPKDAGPKILPINLRRRGERVFGLATYTTTQALDADRLEIDKLQAVFAKPDADLQLNEQVILHLESANRVMAKYTCRVVSVSDGGCALVVVPTQEVALPSHHAIPKVVPSSATNLVAPAPATLIRPIPSTEGSQSQVAQPSSMVSKRPVRRFRSALSSRTPIGLPSFVSLKGLLEQSSDAVSRVFEAGLLTDLRALMAKNCDFVLEATEGDRALRLVVARLNVVAAEKETENGLVGAKDFLVTQGRLALEQASELSARAEAAGADFEVALVKLAVLSSDELLAAKRVHAGEVLRDLIRLGRGRLSWAPLNDPPKVFPPIDLPNFVFGELVDVGLQKKELGLDATCVVSVQNPDAFPLHRLQKFGANNPLLELAGKNQMSAAEIARAISRPPRETLAVLLALQTLGVLSFTTPTALAAGTLKMNRPVVSESVAKRATPPAVDPLKAKTANLQRRLKAILEGNEFEVLGVHWSAYPECLLDAYKARLAEFDRAKFESAVRDALADELDKAIQRIEAAGALLSDKEARRKCREKAVGTMQVEAMVDIYLERAEFAQMRNEREEFADTVKRVLELDPRNTTAREMSRMIS